VIASKAGQFASQAALRVCACLKLPPVKTVGTAESTVLSMLFAIRAPTRVRTRLRANAISPDSAV
jgi:hypothetical protein